jgi:hypothetical protein
LLLVRPSMSSQYLNGTGPIRFVAKPSYLLRGGFYLTPDHFLLGRYAVPIFLFHSSF